MSRVLRISSRNAQFQQWEALLTNRTKRQRSGEFIVHGVRPISLAVQYGWSVRKWLTPAGVSLSNWASDLIERTPATRADMAPDLLAELADREDGAPELVAVVELPRDDFARIPTPSDFLGVAFDRPTSPGNIGNLLRSADAFGASGLVVTGHAADVYDPKSVRASTGSLFTVPAVRATSTDEVLGWVDSVRMSGVPIRVIGTDETGTCDVADHDLTGPTLLVIGNETRGMSAAWRQACDDIVRIPIGGAASSLNAASAGGIVLYESARQRRNLVAQ